MSDVQNARTATTPFLFFAVCSLFACRGQPAERNERSFTKSDPAPGRPSALPSASSHEGTGTFARDPASVIAREKWRLKKCYAPLAKADPLAAGTFTVTVTLASDGKPSAVTVTSSELTLRPIENCVAEAFEAMRFDLPSGNDRFTVPLVFSS